ncbi:MAG: hypothetical protein JEZ03_06390 [Bacteroidales bacterium]|nr:hypothetical protein [Bacteroidales bacterium]
MLKKGLLYIIIVLISSVVCGQTDYNQVIRIDYEDYYEMISVSVSDPGYDRIEVETKYYWFSKGQIHFSYGSYSGKLLNGEYLRYYSNNNLKEKGEFKNGVKSGKWVEWYPNGRIKEMTDLKNGKLHGKKMIYSDLGHLIKAADYKDNMLHGMIRIYNDSLVSISNYCNGKEVIDLPKHNKGGFISRLLKKRAKND